MCDFDAVNKNKQGTSCRIGNDEIAYKFLGFCILDGVLCVLVEDEYGYPVTRVLAGSGFKFDW